MPACYGILSLSLSIRQLQRWKGGRTQVSQGWPNVVMNWWSADDYVCVGSVQVNLVLDRRVVLARVTTVLVLEQACTTSWKEQYGLIKINGRNGWYVFLRHSHCSVPFSPFFLFKNRKILLTELTLMSSSSVPHLSGEEPPGPRANLKPINLFGLSNGTNLCYDN